MGGVFAQCHAMAAARREFGAGAKRESDGPLRSGLRGVAASTTEFDSADAGSSLAATANTGVIELVGSYAPEGECGWSDRRRRIEAAHQKRYREKRG